MYCRFCGNLINDKAVICVKCKNKPLLGRSYCQNCGAPTTQQQAVCTKCGMKLHFELSPEQKKVMSLKKKMDDYKTLTKRMKFFLILDAILTGIGIVVIIFLSIKYSELSQYSGMVSNYYTNQAGTYMLEVIVLLFGVILTGFIELIFYIFFKSRYKKLQKQITTALGGQKK